MYSLLVMMAIYLFTWMDIADIATREPHHRVPFICKEKVVIENEFECMIYTFCDEPYGDQRIIYRLSSWCFIDHPNWMVFKLMVPILYFVM